MKKQLDSVKKFHETYKLGYSISPLATLGNKKNILRNSHITVSKLEGRAHIDTKWILMIV